MPSYDYGCESCNYMMTDVQESIHAEAQTKCPRCGENSLHRVIYGGLGSFMKDVKTIGQAADSNWKKLGSYKRSEIESQSSAAKRERGATSAFSSAGNATKKEINKMTQEQKTRYIIEGKK